MKRDDGFTLAEVTLTIAIVGILMLGMASAFVVSRKAQDNTTDTLSAQTGLDGLTMFLQRDALSAQPPVLVGGQSACGGAATIRLGWTDALSGARYEAAYVQTAGRLTRVLCSDFGAGWSLASTQKLVSQVASASGAAATSSFGRRGVRIDVVTTDGRTLRARGYFRSAT